jgi:hypothetical protein
MRILAGVGAWLLGAGAATAGSLLAVSLLGQGIAQSQGQQLTAAAVKSALAQEGSPAGAQTARPPVPTSTVTRSAVSRPSVTQPALTAPSVTPSATPAVSQTSASPSPQAAVGTVLTSQGGTVVAECRSTGVYLVSWSPTQGYEATGVIRGPAATARAIFESAANSVTMAVSCPDGAAGPPVAASYIRTDGGGTNE